MEITAATVKEILGHIPTERTVKLIKAIEKGVDKACKANPEITPQMAWATVESYISLKMEQQQKGE